MSEAPVTTSHLIVVTWEPKEITAEMICSFISSKISSRPMVRLGRKNTALIQFDEEDSKNVEFLRRSWTDENMWKITNIYGIQPPCTVKVSNVPNEATKNQIYRFFTNKINTHNLRFDPKIEENMISPGEGWCLMNLSSPEARSKNKPRKGILALLRKIKHGGQWARFTDVKKICDSYTKFAKFRDRSLVVERYYEPLDNLLNKSTVIKMETVVQNIDSRKFEYLKTFIKDEVETRLRDHCSKITWGEAEEKVKLSFCCPHQPSHQASVDWSNDVLREFSKQIEEIYVIDRQVSRSIWDEACLVEINFNEFLVKKDPNECLLTIIGSDVERLAHFLSMLDGIKPPPKLLRKTRDVKDEFKLKAFEHFGLARKIAANHDISINVDRKDLQLKITGTKQNLDNADKEITEALLAVHVQRYKIKDRDCVIILNTALMKDEIAAMMKQYDHCLAILQENTLIVLWKGNANADRVYKDVLDLVEIHSVQLDGNVESEGDIKARIKEIEDEFHSLIKLGYTIEKATSKVNVQFKCPVTHTDLVTQQIQSTIGTCLVKTEHIHVSPFLVHQMFENNYVQAIEKDIKSKKFDPKCLIRDRDQNLLRVHGNTKVRERVKELVKRYTEKINVSWIREEEEGIDQYFDQNETRKSLKEMQTINNCSIRIATKNEMKEKSIHCIVLLESGQAIFAGTGDLADPRLPVDAVVNAANGDLDHRGGLAKALSEKGGKVVQQECYAFVHKNGRLKEGQVFIGTAGALNYLKIIHAVGPRWNGGNSNEHDLLAEVVTNILKAVSEERTSVLRSIAVPLISTGIFGFPREEAVKIMMSTLKEKMKDFRCIREIYFYDQNQAVVRTIQEEMEQCFGDNCYHVPVENIGVGKGTMTRLPSGKCLLKREGTRTLPLPGKKRLVIAWGQIERTSADVLVNTTETAPNPTGDINLAFHRAAGVVCDLNRQVQKEFQRKAAGNGGVVCDGTIVSTMAGQMPCQKVYHIKIAAWDDQTGEGRVCEYIRGCLQEAIRCGIKTIAFPTIGTLDSRYDQVKVARASICTVGEFMRSHINSTLEEVRIVIFEEDVSCTAAFENTIENIYSQRPHRLEALIEETTQHENNGEEEPKDVGPDSKKGGAGPGAHGAVKPTTLNITPKVKLELEVGYIEKCQDDVIVCTSSTFPNLQGAISAAITKAGGQQIEKHCKNLYKSYPDNGIATAPGGNLKCQKVYVLKLSEYKQPDDGKIVYSSVKSCLEKVDVHGFASIAFPTIGTGGFKYPDALSASKMFQAISDFFLREKTCIDTVRIVMYPQARMSIQTFTAEARNIFGKRGVPLPQQPPPKDDVVVPANVSSADTWSVPNTKTSIDISFGNLEAAQADVILNTTTSFPNLNGVISASLAKVAGLELQKECTRFPNKVREGDIVETMGYKLQCQKVYHFVLPFWRSSDKQKMIRDKMSDCLHLMRQSGLHSIAIPSIGTGGYQYDPAMVANGIYEAVEGFAQKCPDYQCLVKLVLYPAAAKVNKVFADVLGQVRSGKRAKKGVRFEGDGNDGGHKQNSQPRRQMKARKVKDFVLFRLVSDDIKKEKNVISDIRKKIQEDTKKIDIELKKDKIFDDTEILSVAANKKGIQDIGEGYSTKVLIDLEKGRIYLRGMGENVRKCHERILEEIRDLRSREGQRKVGNVVHQYLEWCYIEDGGKLRVPYPRRIAYMLEDAYKQNDTTKEIKDSDDKHYVVNFNDMKENIKNSKDKKTEVDVIRMDLAIGDIDPLPSIWNAMGSAENLKEVIMKVTDQEYMDVEKEFLSTLGRQATIGQIKRIQNQVVYQQYVTKRKQLQIDLAGVQDIERTLWHGIKEASEAPITANGFNRAYAGNTHGNAWYGLGTYFAVESAYSAQDSYSPVGTDGYKRMYMVKVLTGRTTAVPRGGYNDRFPPLLPGSLTDRYNSTCDDVNNPKEFVIFSDTQAYPEYIILFQ